MQIQRLASLPPLPPPNRPPFPGYIGVRLTPPAQVQLGTKDFPHAVSHLALADTLKKLQLPRSEEHVKRGSTETTYCSDQGLGVATCDRFELYYRDTINTDEALRHLQQTLVESPATPWGTITTHPNADTVDRTFPIGDPNDLDVPKQVLARKYQVDLR